MKRLHVHIRVDDLANARRFYSALFGAAPTINRQDYVKWSLEDPRVNLAISTRCGGQPGIDHLGIQTESATELDALQAQLEQARQELLEERGANCCYAHSDKHWTRDPDGVVWELFHTMGESRVYGEDHGPVRA